MKKYISFLLLLLICFSSCKTENKETINIGVILPLTGSASIWGNNALNGIELAMDEANLESKDYQINLVVEDTQTRTSVAVSALEKVINQNDVPVVIGSTSSSAVLAMAPIAERNQVVILSPGASNPDISNAGDYIFRNWQSDALEGQLVAEYVNNDLEETTAAILKVNNAYGTGLANVFNENFSELGGEVLTEESFEEGATDFRTQLNKIKNLNPEVIFLPGYPSEMALVLQQASDLNIESQFISTQSFDDPSIVNIAGEAAEGTIFSTPAPPDTTKPIVRNFIDSYTGKYNEKPGVCSNTGYDAMKIVLEAINLGSRNGADFKNYLDSLENFSGAAGTTTFDENGDVQKAFVFNKIEEGEKIILE